VRTKRRRRRKRKRGKTKEEATTTEVEGTPRETERLAAGRPRRLPRLQQPIPPSRLLSGLRPPAKSRTGLR